MFNLPPRLWREIKKYEQWVHKSYNTEDDWIYHTLLFLSSNIRQDIISETGKAKIYVQSTKPPNLNKNDLWFNTKDKTWYHWDGSRLDYHFKTDRFFGFTIAPIQYIEICPNTLQIINQFPQPTSYSHGTGGSTEKLFGSARQAPKIFRLCPFTFSIIQSCIYFPEREDLAGITHNRLFGLHTPFGDKIDEINLHTLSIISQNPIVDNTQSIGGMANRLFGIDTNHRPPQVIEFCTNTLSIISSLTPTISASFRGIGGITNKLFLVVYPQPHDAHLGEVNPNNMAVIRHVKLFTNPLTDLRTLDGIK